jgi:predicted site-specific integrase-resolvase
MSKVTRTDYMYSKRVTYSAIARDIREGKIECHMIDGKILIDEDEADEYCTKKREAKVAALKSADLFA